MTAKEAVEQINAEKILSPHHVEDVLDMEGIAEVATQDYDKHRWYIDATVVFKTGDEFFGVRGPIILRSENMGYSDIERECTAFEMKPVPSVAYERIS